jgi:hypothetical protein
MKIEMLNNYGGLKKGRIYEIKDATGKWLIQANKARVPGKFFVKGDDATKQDIKEPAKPRAKRTRKKK